MRKLTLILAATFVAFLSATAASARPIEGEWYTKDGNAKVKLGPCGPDLCAQIVWLRRPIDPTMGGPLLDDHNPDPALRQRPRLGLEVLTAMRPSGADHWSGGRIYDPNSGKTYDSKMTLNPDGTLKVEGCVAIVCLAQTWTRAD